MFYHTANEWRFDESQQVSDLRGVSGYLPIEADTEFTHPEYDLNNPSSIICTNITAQFRGVHQKEGLIFAHQDISNIARHPVFNYECGVFDYLLSNGYSVKLTRLPRWNYLTINTPVLELKIFAFFALAELERIFLKQMREDIRYLCVTPYSQGIDQGRRIRTYSGSGVTYKESVQLPWLAEINGYTYRLHLSFVDTCAVQGKTDYNNFLINSGINPKYKDTFEKHEKARMLEMYQKRPVDFDNYALGDLFNYQALEGYADLLKDVYTLLGIESFYRLPRLTVGATVKNITEAVFLNHFGTQPNDRALINKFCRPGTSDHLKKMSTSTACLNAKVDGGRCRNNRPIDTTVRGVICDIDISGCYGEGLRVQTYPFGIPVIIDYPLDSKDNDYMTLREFLKLYKNELVPGLWQARVSTKEGYVLSTKQDFLVSWLPPRDISKLVTDSEFEGTDEWWTVDNVGEIKIFNHEVSKGILTHDLLQLIENVASTSQRKELLDNLVIETVVFYPASERVNTVDELVEAHANHKGLNKTSYRKERGKGTKVSKEQSCHKWYGVALGEILVTDLLVERKKHPKKSPMNELYKLVINTIYGDMVSPFFTVGNVVVGNNITARARTFAWLMEKGLHGFQSITDGCAFEINRVLYPRGNRRVNAEMAVNLYLDKEMRHHSFQPLGKLNSDVVFTDNGLVIDNEILNLDKAKEWAAKAAMSHLQELFPDMDVLHQETTDIYGNKRVGQYSLEVKSFYDTATFHGTANYCFSYKDKDDTAMRSYSKKEHMIISLSDELQVISTTEKPSETFLKALRCPVRVERSDVHIKSKILKVGDYKRHHASWDGSEVYPGCNVETPGLLKEFSLTQFTFNTLEQYKSWKREYDKLIRKYGQSYEMFYLNEDGTLNYQKMIVDIDKRIRENKTSYFDGMDKRQKNVYRQQTQHIKQECLERVREMINTRYHGSIDTDEKTLSDDAILTDDN